MADTYEVFLGSISQEKNWTDSVRNDDNEHMVAWGSYVHYLNALFVELIKGCHILVNKYLAPDQARQLDHPV